MQQEGGLRQDALWEGTSVLRTQMKIRRREQQWRKTAMDMPGGGERRCKVCTRGPGPRRWGCSAQSTDMQDTESEASLGVQLMKSVCTRWVRGPQEAAGHTILRPGEDLGQT